MRVVRGSWFHAGAPWRLLGSFGVVGFTQVRPRCRRVHSESLGSLGCALGIARVHSWSFGLCGCAMGVVVFSRGLWVVRPRWSWGSFGFVRFARVRPAGQQVHSGSLGSLGSALGVVGFIWVRWVH